MQTLYEQDFYAWTQQQMILIKNEQYNQLDIQHLYEELEGLGASQHKEARNRLKILLTHLLKWKFQPDYRCNSWKFTIKTQRRDLKEHLENNSSLKHYLNDYLISSYESSRDKSHEETGIFLDNFPIKCPWTIEQILDDEFYPN